MRYETEKLEFKQVATNEIYKEVVAFANTDGGVLIIGIDDDGNIEPLRNLDKTYTAITNGIRDGITPDVTMFVKYSLENNETIKIEVSEGSFKPYYLKSKGLKPSGVYVRQGNSSVPASSEQIRQMIKDTEKDIFEEFPSSEQNLTFEECTKSFEKHGKILDETKYNMLGMWSNQRQLFTNLGLLLSDQCKHTIKTAVFEDEANTIFKARKEFSGSLLKQVDDAFNYLLLLNNNRSVISGLVRQDTWDYPEAALREAILNAVIHRNYEFSGSIIINVNKKRIEFISIGGLLPGITKEDILIGVSQLRNKRLSEIFLRLNIIEAYGTGIRRIFELYEKYNLTPDISIGPNSFRLTLPNVNEN